MTAELRGPQRSGHVTPEQVDARTSTPIEAEATAISHVTAVISAVLVAGSGVLAFAGLLQASGLALFAALATSIASVAGRPSRGARWVGPVVIGAAIVTVVLTGFARGR